MIGPPGIIGQTQSPASQIGLGVTQVRDAR